MNHKIRLLLVEDNKPDQDVWTNLLELHSAKAEKPGDPVFELTIATTLEEAKSAIDSRDFDAAVVDLRLANVVADGMDSGGNEIIEILLGAEMAAVAAFTGEPGAVEIPGHAKPVVRIFTKGGGEGEGSGAVLAWLLEQAPMIVAIRSAEELIKREMATFFVRSIWPRWNNWLASEEAQNADFLATAMARHLTSHVHAALLDRYKQKAHPEEWFMVPPIHSGIRTGDIIRTDKHGLEIVVTPRCDLATGKRKTLQLASCSDVSGEWQKLTDKFVVLQKRALELEANKQPRPDDLQKDLAASENKIRAFTQHRSTSSLHFLPRMKLLDGTMVGPLMINFDQIRSEAIGNIEQEVLGNRIASVSSEFVPSIVERLGSYFSRIGTPDFSDVEP